MGRPKSDMSEQKGPGFFHASFTYTDEVLSDFEALYLQKKEITPATRVALGALGLAGAIYFGYTLYNEGFQFTRVGYLLICSILLVVAFSRAGKRPDDTLKKYRKHYLNKGAAFKVDDSGVELKLEGQQSYARSRFKEIYGLYETDLCFYFVIKGKAYYILPKASVEGGTAEELRKYMQKKCAKRFLQYDVSKQ